MTFTTGRAKAAEVELAYDVSGESGMPLVLIMGIGLQRVWWEDDFCQQFVEAGFQVVRFDHRDTGESSWLDARPPHPMRAMARRFVGMTVPSPYTLRDMADDVVAVMDSLGWASAHVMGISLGGMIGQELALAHPTRVRSLTSIMSTPGARRYSPQPRALGALLAKAPKTREEAGAHAERVFSTIGSQAWPADPARLRANAERAWDRGTNPRGFLRHFSAALASGSRVPRLRDLTAPTLVIHGSLDPMFPLAAGRALASLVPDGTWLPIAGMGHDLPRPLWPVLVSAIHRHAASADARAKHPS